MRVVVAGLAAVLIAAAPAGAAGGLTRAKAERLVERKARATYDLPGAAVNADCRRAGRRTFTCTWTATARTREDGTRAGTATVRARKAARPRVTLRLTSASTYDDRG